jgi:phage gp45-like
MTNILANIIKSHASALDRSIGQVKFGTVTSVNPANATVRVVVQPEGVLSGWLPTLSHWIGNGWGIVSPPSPGDQVAIIPQEGDIEQGLVIGCIFSDKQRPPPAPSGEFWLVHGTGSSLKLCNDGTIRISGDLQVSGDIYDKHGSIGTLRQHYNSHVHSTANNTLTSPPTIQD